jgi:Mg-chelatase subunit ChlD
MTNPDLTRLVIVADRSGSMHGIAGDMNGAIRQLLIEQATQPGTLVVDIVTFDTVVEYPYTGVAPAEVTDDIIRPRGSTALNDAVGLTIAKLGAELSSLAEDDRPGHVIVVVVTDGMENASREYTTQQVKAMVEEQTGKWGWTFLYLAANVDAFATGAGYGFARGQTISYAADSEGAESVVKSASAGITRTRSGLSTDFTDEEREAAHS